MRQSWGKRLIVSLVVAGGITCAAVSLAYANMLDRNAEDFKHPVMMEADRLDYDKATATVKAAGHVEVVQGDRILLADSLTYNQNSNIVKATGNVTVLEPSGNVYFADHVMLQDDLKRGVVEQFRIRLSDNSVFAAREARRISDSVTQLFKAVYSPCKLCKEDPARAPLWQIKADTVVYDKAAQEISYENAYFELYGVPIMYTPRLVHATPDADRKSGLLVPEYSHSSNLGFSVKVPYYINIAPDKDATLTPIFTGQEGVVLAGEYRQRFDAGYMELSGSATNPVRRDDAGNEISGHELRGHLFGSGHFDINDTYAWGFGVERATDDTYLRKYNFSTADTLTSRAYVDGVGNNWWGSAQGLSFQGLSAADDPDSTPLVAPLVDMHYHSDPLLMGSRLSLDANALSLSREIGSDTRRLSSQVAWTLPYITRGGQWFELETSLRTDGYVVSDVTQSSSGDEFDGSVGRVVPQIALHYRYPLIKQLDASSLILEPTVSLIASPNSKHDSKIPNEDNLSLEFSDANLFDSNRFTGLDVIESGSRMNYGVRARWQFNDNRAVSALLGQNYSFNDNNPYIATQGGNNASDYVGRVAIEYAPLDFSYRFLIDRDDAALKRNDVNSSLDLHPVTLFANYTSIEDDPTQTDRRELLTAMSVALNENWTWSTNGRRDLGAAEGWVSAGTSLAFHNECLTLWSNVNRTFIRDRDVEPDTSFSLRFSLKNLN